jgi:hypothetical protein
VSWLEDDDTNLPATPDVKSVYEAIWRTTPDITIPFTATGVDHVVGIRHDISGHYFTGHKGTSESHMEKYRLRARRY